MRSRRLGPLLVLLLCAWQASAAPGEAIVIVAHRDTAVQVLSREAVADIFLGRSLSLSPGISAVPLDSSDPDLRERFYQSVANMTPTRLKAYWSRLVFSGRGRPPTEIELDEVGQRLMEDTGALTYLRSQQVTPVMKVLLELP